jgi:hypothetical protein
MYDTLFKADKIETVAGTVEKVKAFYPEKSSCAWLLLVVSLPEDQKATVHVSPECYATKHDFTFRRGDRVTITGSRTEFEGKPVIMATEIERDGRVLHLRSEDGKPKWLAESEM